MGRYVTNRDVVFIFKEATQPQLVGSAKHEPSNTVQELIGRPS